jgi:hypothetical protein
MSDYKQLRGQALLDLIESSLRKLASGKENYIYNASELSRLTGCSRPTLAKKEAFIDEVLNKIGAEKRIKKDHPMMEHLYSKIKSLEDDNARLTKELTALRQNHVAIYSKLYIHSIGSSVLFKNIIEAETISNGKCILCDTPIKEGHHFPDNSTIVNMIDYKNKTDS